MSSLAGQYKKVRLDLCLEQQVDKSSSTTRMPPIELNKSAVDCTARSTRTHTVFGYICIADNQQESTLKDVVEVPSMLVIRHRLSSCR